MAGTRIYARGRSRGIERIPDIIVFNKRMLFVGLTQELGEDSEVSL